MELLIPMGHCHPMYCSAMGRAMLAYMPQAEVEKVLRASELQKLTPETKIDLREINQELIHTRQKGYCILFDELAESKSSLAAPIFDRNRNPIAAISVSASAQSLSQPQRERELAKARDDRGRKDLRQAGLLPKMKTTHRRGRPFPNAAARFHREKQKLFAVAPLCKQLHHMQLTYRSAKSKTVF